MADIKNKPALPEGDKSWAPNPEGKYRCNCGQAFDHPMARTAHSANCLPEGDEFPDQRFRDWAATKSWSGPKDISRDIAVWAWSLRGEEVARLKEQLCITIGIEAEVYELKQQVAGLVEALKIYRDADFEADPEQASHADAALAQFGGPDGK